jgi:hypothetical protein
MCAAQDFAVIKISVGLDYTSVRLGSLFLYLPLRK